jgi:8-oxo-dGTP pyrophosphatase MutT (NUDIX family)
LPIKSLKPLASRHIHPNVRIDTCELPNGQTIEPIILEFGDWACVFALTKQQEVLLIRLYRRGVDKIIWEIPGGMIDPGETPLKAASRELLEETGYGGGSIVEMAAISPNPDNHTNKMHYFLACDVEKVGPQHSDDLDRIEVHPTPLDEVIRMAQNGELLQSMHICALFFALSRLNRIAR